ncbi:MAG TPA: right-handed parallel beta-helix repeat-containing protein [Pyrinomonadaceae bacterium]|jgi:parallel beta-helix repeat protein
MKKILEMFQQHRLAVFSAMIIMALVGAGSLTSQRVSANHPVLVEGNCDSPTPGTTSVPQSNMTSGGICGDFDGDGRIGTAEDTDGADRIFGTLAAALGPGTGAAAGTGANQNGSITIVASGRFATSMVITADGGTPGGRGTVVVQAAPGVEATLDAVLQGDPAGGNITREAQVGVVVNAGPESRVILRNLRIRNFIEGIRALGSSNLTVENCRLENNFFYGIRMLGNSRLGMIGSSVIGTGYRVSASGSCPSTTCTPVPAHAIAFEESSAGTVAQTHVSGNFGAALVNTSTLGTNAVRYYELFDSNNGGGIANAVRVLF